MVFKNPLQYLLVKRLRIAKTVAATMIAEGKIMVNDEVVFENIYITESDKVFFGKKMINEGKKLFYLAFYKPCGIETTMNPAIEQNLLTVLPFEEKLFPCGRLDKASEGLLLLTNDGRFYHQIVKKDFETPKTYLVTVDKPIDDDFCRAMSEGIVIMGKKTLPCEVGVFSEKIFRITLIEGRNRQIRRMTYKLGYEVTRLVRTNIGRVAVGDLQPGEYLFLEKDMIL